MKLCKRFEIAGYAILLEQSETITKGTKYPKDGTKLFKVTYGAEVHSRLTYNEACMELGACLMHAIACEGNLDNS